MFQSSQFVRGAVRACLVVAGLCAVARTALAQPTIANPNFEADGGSFTVASGWTSFGGNKWEGIWTSDRVWAQGVTDIPAGGRCGVYQVIGVTAGASYRLAVYGRTNSTDYDASIGVAPAGGTNPDTATYGTTSSSSSWVQVTVDFTAAAANVTVFLRARNTKTWALPGIWGYFDGVTIEATTPANRPPVAVASAIPTSGSPPLLAQFDASGSSDPDNDPLTYDWDFGDGSTHGSSVAASHTFTTGGTYQVVLTINDGHGNADTDAVTISVASSGDPVGPNLLANPSFEGGFSGGVADAWQSWTASGSGYWKQSSRLGRIGVGMYYNNSNPVSAAVAIKPKTILLMDDMLGASGTLRANLPDALIIGRRWIDDRFNTYVSDPEYYGVVFADETAGLAAQHPAINAWQGFNEPYLNDVATARKVGRFEKAFAQHLHTHGVKACVLSVAVGNPGDMNNMLLQEIVDCLAVADYVGYHAYGGLNDQLMMGPESPWYANRWRFYVDMYAARGYRMPPVVYTECTTFYAWKGRFTSEQIRDDLKAFEAQSKYHDPWSVGMCIYLCGSNAAWQGWEIANEPTIYNGCGSHNQDHPADAWDGIYSQQFGQNGAGGFTGGIVQSVDVQWGKTYRLESAMKYETYGVGAAVAFQMGIDPTGQTVDPGASTITWAGDLIASGPRETDWWYEGSFDRRATGPRVSVWLKASQPAGKPAFRVSVDGLRLRELNVPVSTAPGDLDRDGDVDLTDFSFFQMCFNGPNRPIPATTGCDQADLDSDTDVDLADFATFQGCFNGPNRPPACG